MNKKTFLMVAILTICMLPSCEQEESKSVSIDSASLSIGLVGGYKTVLITANAAWTATTNESWLSVSPTSGNGSAYVTITAAMGNEAEAAVLFSAGSASAKLTVKREGTITGLFSVSAKKQVKFAPGNLQYQASTNTWRFANHQYDIVGIGNATDPNKQNYVAGNVPDSDNRQISSSYSGWIDLFGWGTSGYNDKNPWIISTTSSDYGDGENDIANTNYDWGGVQ